MRIVGGYLGGRQFNKPPSRRTHPMSEKTRGALFNALGDVKGLSILDTFTGSGALAYEAASRGAKRVVAIELDSSALKNVVSNLHDLGLEDTVKAVRSHAGTWSRNNKAQQFDVVICDPPYDDIKPDLLQQLTRHCKPGGVFVVSWPGKEKTRVFTGLEQLKANNYGDAQLVFYKKIQGSSS